MEAKHTGLPGFYGLPLKTRRMLAHFSHHRRTAVTEYGSRRPRLLACRCFHTLSTSLIRLCKPQRWEGWDGVMTGWGLGGISSHVSQEFEECQLYAMCQCRWAGFFYSLLELGVESYLELYHWAIPPWPLACFREDQTHAGSLLLNPSGWSFYWIPISEEL